MVLSVKTCLERAFTDGTVPSQPNSYAKVSNSEKSNETPNKSKPHISKTDMKESY